MRPIPLPPVVRSWRQRALHLRVGSAGVTAGGSSLGRSQRGRGSPPRASRGGRASSFRRPTPPLLLAQVVTGAQLGRGEWRRVLHWWRRLGRRKVGRVAPQRGFRRWGGVSASGGRRPHCRAPRGRQRARASALRRSLLRSGGCHRAPGSARDSFVAGRATVASGLAWAARSRLAAASSDSFRRPGQRHLSRLGCRPGWSPRSTSPSSLSST